MLNNIRILNPEDYSSMPWKNGLGHTVGIFKKEQPDDERFAMWAGSTVGIDYDFSAS